MKKIEVDGVILRDGYIKCLWHGPMGFGELDIDANREDPSGDDYYTDETNSFKIYTECLGEKFYHQVLNAMVEYLKTHSIIIE